MMVGIPLDNQYFLQQLYRPKEKEDCHALARTEKVLMANAAFSILEPVTALGKQRKLSLCTNINPWSTPANDLLPIYSHKPGTHHLPKAGSFFHGTENRPKAKLRRPTR